MDCRPVHDNDVAQSPVFRRLSGRDEKGNSLTEKPEIRVKPHSYQPSKAELDEVFDVRNADGSMLLPEDVARRVFRPMKIVEDSDA